MLIVAGDTTSALHALVKAGARDTIFIVTRAPEIAAGQAKGGRWWDSALLQTAAGGVLAVWAGAATEVFRGRWRRYELAERLAEEIENVASLLERVAVLLTVDHDRASRELDGVAVARRSYGRIADAIAATLRPADVHLVADWYAEVKREEETVRGTIGGLGTVLSRNPPESEAVVLQRALGERVAANLRVVGARGTSYARWVRASNRWWTGGGRRRRQPLG